MKKTVLSVAAMLFALAGCGPAPESAPNATRNPAVPAATGDALQLVQESGKPEVTTEKVAGDVVGRVVRVSAVRGTGPETEWTFEASEFRHVDILDRKPAGQGMTLVIFMTTRNNPRPGEDHVEVSGKLQLHYEWKAGKWTLARIENLTFRYSVGLAT